MITALALALGSSALVPPMIDELLAAAGVDPAAVSTSAITGVPDQYAVFEQLGTAVPLEGANFVWLSTGVAGAGTSQVVNPSGQPPEPGTDLGGVCIEADKFDCVHLEFTTVVPPGMDTLSFGFNFVTAEYPEFVGSQYNDEFVVSLIRPGITYANLFASDPMTASNPSVGQGCILLTDTGYEKYSNLAGPLCDSGGTGVLTASAPVAPGETITLAFDLFERGDAAWDTSVLIDNVIFSATGVAEPTIGSGVQVDVMSPVAVSPPGGNTVNVTGLGLSGVTRVQVGRSFQELVDTEFTEIDDTLLTFVAPPGPVGDAYVVVSAQPSGNPTVGASELQDFRYVVFFGTLADDGCNCTLVPQPSGRGLVVGAMMLVGFGGVVVSRRRGG